MYFNTSYKTSDLHTFREHLDSAKDYVTRIETNKYEDDDHKNILITLYAKQPNGRYDVLFFFKVDSFLLEWLFNVYVPNMLNKRYNRISTFTNSYKFYE